LYVRFTTEYISTYRERCHFILLSTKQWRVTECSYSHC